MKKLIGAPEETSTAGHRSGRGVESILQHMHRDARQRSAPAAPGLSSVAIRAKHTILVVDDIEANRYALTRTLRAAGYNVAEASLGSDALKMASASSGVLLDVQLPDELGFSVCAKLRRDPRTADLPVIMMSAVFVEDSDRNHGAGSGADTYLVAPIDPAHLVEAFDVLLQVCGLS